MKVPVLQSCCFCVSLRKGTIIIAVLGIMFEISAFIGSAYAKQHAISHAKSRNATETEDETFFSIFVEEWSANTTSEIVGGIFVLCLYILLLCGIYFRNEKLFLLWLAVEAFTLGLYAIGIIILPIMLPILIPNNSSLCVGIFAVFATVFAIAIYSYFVVYAYYREVKVTNKALERGIQLHNLDDAEN